MLTLESRVEIAVLLRQGMSIRAIARHLRCSRQTDKENILSNTFGTIMVWDAFAGYVRLFSAEREGGPLTEAACWAHACRKIYDVYIST